MFENIQTLRMAAAMAAHAGTRQAVVAQNIANADTPGYIARDVTAFADLVHQDAGGFHVRATRTSHLQGQMSPLHPEISEDESAATNPNKNGVILEDEMLKAVEVKRQHDRALAIYRSGLMVLRSSLGRG